MIRQNKVIKNFWMIFFGVLAALAIATAVIIGVVASMRIEKMRMSQVTDENYYKVSQENGYKRSLYAACDSMKNIDANLGKIAVSNDVAHQTQMLTDVVIHANAVNQNIANLPIADSDNLVACQRFVNQTQDYATYLIGKLAKGNKLEAGERAALLSLDGAATELYGFLKDYADGDSGMFITNGNGMGNVGRLSDSLNEVDENAFTYEKLIYDGPFSESIEAKKINMGSKISHEEGSKKLAELFGDNTFVSELANKQGKIYIYDLEDGRVMLTADGRVAQYEVYNEAQGESSLGCDKCIEIAEEFCNKLGYDVKGVWVSKTQDFVTYVNCATVIDGVIVYPDLIKVAVDSATGEVVGMEARAYLMNHRDWDVYFGSVSQDDAQAVVGNGLRVTNVAKVLIEKNNEHYLCYEFECMIGESEYYVYIDSKTGNEVELFKVIENTEGYTVM
ncbi:MAG: germination protein YpeB [Clostridiales bacterium]|nr:germination protein YpeB [Clostridiales bacterium]